MSNEVVYFTSVVYGTILLGLCCIYNSMTDISMYIIISTELQDKSDFKAIL